MLLRFSSLRPTLSFSLAVTLFALNLQYPAYAKTDAKRRQRLFRILTSTDDKTEQKRVNATSGATNVEYKTVLDNDSKLSDTIGIVAEDNKNPPLISGSNSQLTLSMMGKFKKTWCKTEPFMQVIKEKGCISRKVMNRFCYGQCNSFYIPRTIRTRTKHKVFKSCGFCKPKRTHTVRVTLKYPGRSNGYKHKHVKVVKQCRCMER